MDVFGSPVSFWQVGAFLFFLMIYGTGIWSLVFRKKRGLNAWMDENVVATIIAILAAAIIIQILYAIAQSTSLFKAPLFMEYSIAAFCGVIAGLVFGNFHANIEA